jgi:hypothetical protein
MSSISVSSGACLWSFQLPSVQYPRASLAVFLVSPFPNTGITPCQTLCTKCLSMLSAVLGVFIQDFIDS